MPAGVPDEQAPLLHMIIHRPSTFHLIALLLEHRLPKPSGAGLSVAELSLIQAFHPHSTVKTQSQGPRLTSREAGNQKAALPATKYECLELVLLLFGTSISG